MKLNEENPTREKCSLNRQENESCIR